MGALVAQARESAANGTKEEVLGAVNHLQQRVCEMDLDPNESPEQWRQRSDEDMRRWIEETERSAASLSPPLNTPLLVPDEASEQREHAGEQDVEGVGKAVCTEAKEKQCAEEHGGKCSDEQEEQAECDEQDAAPHLPQASRKVLDPRLLDAIEAEAHELASSVHSIMEGTRSSLCRASHLSAECAKTFDEAVTHMGSEVHGATAALEALMDECTELEGCFDDIDATHARIKAIRTGVDQLDGLVRRSRKLKDLKATSLT